MGKPPRDDELIPTLIGEAKKAVEHRGSHLQIIASAGSGKTETVSQRVASLIAEGVDKAVAAGDASHGQYWILFPCYLIILYYAIAGHKVGLKK